MAKRKFGIAKSHVNIVIAGHVGHCGVSLTSAITEVLVGHGEIQTKVSQQVDVAPEEQARKSYFSAYHLWDGTGDHRHAQDDNRTGCGGPRLLGKHNGSGDGVLITVGLVTEDLEGDELIEEIVCVESAISGNNESVSKADRCGSAPALRVTCFGDPVCILATGMIAIMDKLRRELEVRDKAGSDHPTDKRDHTKTTPPAHAGTQPGLERAAARLAISSRREFCPTAYQETTETSTSAQSPFTRQTSNHSQHSNCLSEIEPMEPECLNLVSKTMDGIIPTERMPAIEAGMKKAFGGSISAGAGMWIDVFNDSCHGTDSSEVPLMVMALEAMPESPAPCQNPENGGSTATKMAENQSCTSVFMRRFAAVVDCDYISAPLLGAFGNLIRKGTLTNPIGDPAFWSLISSRGSHWVERPARPAPDAQKLIGQDVEATVHQAACADRAKPTSERTAGSEMHSDSGVDHRDHTNTMPTGVDRSVRARGKLRTAGGPEPHTREVSPLECADVFFRGIGAQARPYVWEV